MLDAGIERKIVQKSGSYFSFGDERLGQGRQNATAFLQEHPDVGQTDPREVQARVGPGQVVSARLAAGAVAANGDAPTVEEQADAIAEEEEVVAAKK